MKGMIKESWLQNHEKRHQLAIVAENSLLYVVISEEAAELLAQGIICDVFEGHSL